MSHFSPSSALRWRARSRPSCADPSVSRASAVPGRISWCPCRVREGLREPGRLRSKPLVDPSRPADRPAGREAHRNQKLFPSTADTLEPFLLGIKYLLTIQSSEDTSGGRAPDLPTSHRRGTLRESERYATRSSRLFRDEVGESGSAGTGFFFDLGR